MIRDSLKTAGLPALVLAILVLICIGQCSSTPKTLRFDCIIANGLIIDGTGKPGVRADLGLAGRKIAAIGRLDRSRAGRVIDARGLVVAPGFIDIHTHCDRGILDFPLAENFIRQGVTTVIGGNCGRHPYPVRDFFRRAEERGICPNWGLFVGHNTVREKIMGSKNAPPTAEEMRLMKALVEEEMMSGAWGLSTGLSYRPGMYADTEEVIDLAGAASRLGGIYATHLRSYDLGITDAIHEAVRVGRNNRMPVQISHIKLADEAVWGNLGMITEPLQDARRWGVEVTLDIYPYTAAFMGLTNSFPPWSYEDGPARFAAKLRNPVLYERIKSSVIDKRFRSARGVNTLKAIILGDCPPYPHYGGLTVEQILVRRGLKPTPEAAAELLIDLEKNGGASAAFVQMDEADVQALIRRAEVMIASDAGLARPDTGNPHPRACGTFSRVIGRYVKEKRVLTLEEAIRKMTSLPAGVLKLRDRGGLREGMWADIVIFDPTLVQDTATYQNPRQFSPGLITVLINGEIVLDKGRCTGQKPGRVLYGPAKRGIKS